MATKKKAARKAAPKKAAPKKAAVQPAVLKPAAKPKPQLESLSVTPPANKPKPGNDNGINIDITFKGASGGTLTATLFRADSEVSATIKSTGAISFPNVVKGDAISLNGSCAGSTIINANRTVRTGSGKPLPLTIAGVILESFDILQ